MRRAAQSVFFFSVGSAEVLVPDAESVVTQVQPIIFLHHDWLEALAVAHKLANTFERETFKEEPPPEYQLLFLMLQFLTL